MNKMKNRQLCVCAARVSLCVFGERCAVMMNEEDAALFPKKKVL